MEKNLNHAFPGGADGFSDRDGIAIHKLVSCFCHKIVFNRAIIKLEERKEADFMNIIRIEATGDWNG